MEDLDFKRLIAEASARHGVRIDPDDPITVVVTLNRLVFEQAVATAVAEITEATRAFTIAADAANQRLGAVMGREFTNGLARLAVRQPSRAEKCAVLIFCLLLGLVAGFGIGYVIILIHWMRG